MNILDKLQAAIADAPDKIPPGYKTTKEWATIFKLGERATLSYLRKSADCGIGEIKVFRIKIDGRTLRPVPHYKLNLK